MNNCNISCDISHDIVCDLLGLTMLIYDYNKKFILDKNETIEEFLNSFQKNNELLEELTDARKNVILDLSDTSSKGKVEEFISEIETDLQVGITTSEKNKRISIIFRGSESKKDWMHDLNIVKYELEKNVYVHSGFFNQLHKNNVFEKILNKTKELIENNPEYSVYITGHSLGAALSTLCGYQLSNEITDKITVVNFASPRIGNMNFKNKCNNKDNLCIYRITNDRDIVTATPMINFKHVGTNIRITENKIDLYKNNSYPWWSYSLWYCWRISDHNVDLYYERLVKHKWN